MFLSINRLPNDILGNGGKPDLRAAQALQEGLWTVWKTENKQISMYRNMRKKKAHL
jgi:hypothetical protein